MIPVYLINLDRSPDRLVCMAEQLRQLDVAFTRVPAFDGSLMTPDMKAAWVAARTFDPSHEWLSGQIGCLESHLSVWALIGQGRANHAVVIEDDVHLAADFGRLCTGVDWLPEDADIVRLETTLTGMRLGSESPVRRTKRTLRRILTSAYATGGYVIRRDVAALLARTPPRLQTPPDYLMFDPARSFVAADLRTYQLSPACVVQDKYFPDKTSKYGFDSLIDPDYDEYYKHRRHPLRRLSTPVLRRLLRREVVGFA